MRSFHYLAAVIALTTGCAGNEDPTSVTPPGGGDVTVQSTAAGVVAAGETQAPGAMCAAASAPGTVLARTQLSGDPDGAGLVMNANGEVAFTTKVLTGFTPEAISMFATHVSKLDANLQKIYEYQYPDGSAIALDASGRVYVAGGFREPTDLGLGVVTPTGNVDTFLVVIAPGGDVESVRHLGILCGDGVTDIAVSADGRIAISGSAMGTVVLENAGGDIVFQSGASGHVGFDAAGNLVIGGSFTGRLDLGGGHVVVAGASDDVDAFVAKLDARGDVVYTATFGDTALPVEVRGWEQDTIVTAPRAQRIVDVAVNAAGEVAVVGDYDLEMELLGQVLKTGSYFPSGSQIGSFAARLDAGGDVTYGMNRGPIHLNLQDPSVAIGADGRLAISANDPGNAQGPFAYPNLTYVTAGGVATMRFGQTGYSGYGLGVAHDACGNVLWASFQNEPSILDPHAFLTLVAQ